jgi:phosphohistidine swiveling domain-containing protein
MSDDIVERLRTGAWANSAVGAVDHATDLSTAADIIEAVSKAADIINAERALADDLAAVLAVLRDEVDPWFGDQATEVLARYREARQ